jgi:hypothetical protein
MFKLYPDGLSTGPIIHKIRLSIPFTRCPNLTMVAEIQDVRADQRLVPRKANNPV